MATYIYKGVKPNGEVLEGEMEATEQAEVIRYLQREGFVPVRAVEAKRTLGLELGLARRPKGKQVSPKQVMLLTRELATLLEAGLTLDRSFQILIDLAENPALGRLMSALQEKVRGGASFSAALESQGKLFSRLYVNTVRAGEVGGALQEVMARLADYLERSSELRESVKSALIYPTILLVVAGLSVTLLLTLVVPQFAQMFADMGQTLPLPTQIVIGIGELFRGYWWALLILITVLVLAFRAHLARPAVRYVWDKRLLHMPLVGDLLAKVETARFCRTLATLVENGVPLLGALTLVKDVVTNRVISEGIGQAAERLKRGRGLTEPLMELKILPPLALQMIKVGEESGRLEPMLAKVADVFDQEVRATVQRLLALLEPMLIVGLGVVVAGIIMSILVAILSVNQLAF